MSPHHMRVSGSARVRSWGRMSVAGAPEIGAAGTAEEAWSAPPRKRRRKSRSLSPPACGWRVLDVSSPALRLHERGEKEGPTMLSAPSSPTFGSSKRRYRRRGPRRRTSSGCLLPTELVVEVMTRLPVVDRLRCRLVCKSWDRALMDPSLGLTSVSGIDELQSAYERQRRYVAEVQDFTALQTDLLPSMRPILVDWLLDVSAELSLPQEVLFAGVRLLDMFLSRVRVPRTNLQLVGCVCQWLSAKLLHVDHLVPIATDLIVVSANAFTHAQLLHAEREVVTSLDFRLLPITSCDFLCQYLDRAAKGCLISSCSSSSAPEATAVATLGQLVSYCLSGTLREAFLSWAHGLRQRRDESDCAVLAWFLAELALHDQRFCTVDQSYVAASSVLLAYAVLTGHDPSGGAACEWLTLHFSWDDIGPYVVALIEDVALFSATKNPALFHKYANLLELS